MTDSYSQRQSLTPNKGGIPPQSHNHQKMSSSNHPGNRSHGHHHFIPNQMHQRYEVGADMHRSGQTTREMECQEGQLKHDNSSLSIKDQIQSPIIQRDTSQRKL